MSVFSKRIICLVLLVSPLVGFTQTSNYRTRTLSTLGDTIQLDSLSIYPNSFELKCGGQTLGTEHYTLDYAGSKLIMSIPCDGELTASYRVLPMDLSRVYATRDTSMIYSKEKGFRDRFLISSFATSNDIFGGASLNKSGSISRGISFGNNQDMGVNSSLNLELSGQIAPNLKLLASVTDDNLPIQPQGNTNTLREFDQVFIQIYNDRFKLIAGDFWLYKPQGYFMKYKKRAQGLTIDYQWTTDTSKVLRTQISGALSRGKFNRQIIQGAEGNQGPYRLYGKENEPFIIILAGTERVYLDGRLMERGQEYDYVVDYNSSEVIFTSRNLITKDSRIVIEFQYSDQNYARSLFQTSTTYVSERVKFWLNGYSEQDAKNQTLQQELSIGQKKLLADIGDTLSLARMSSIDSVGYFDNQNLYALIDSVIGLVTYDSVLVHSVHPDSAFYRATFEFVGLGNGNYILDNFNALGKVFKWVEPDPITGVPQGDYAPSRLMVTPKKRQMISAGVNIQITKRLYFETELAYSHNDLNTFSGHDAADNDSYSGMTRLVGDIALNKDSIPKWILRTKLEVEARERNFNPIEQYRAVEFDRDWNTRNMGYTGNQVASSLSTNFINRKYGNFNLEGQHYVIGGDYEGIRGKLDGSWKQKGFRGKWDISYLSSQAAERNEFLRHRTDFSQSIGWFRFGYRDDHELNQFRNDFLQPQSYQFFDYQFYIANSDSIKNEYRIFYRERFDRRSDSTNLIPIARARSLGAELRFTEWKNQKLNFVASYRELKILDSVLANQTPENTVIGRIEHEISAFKGALTLNTFYEIGSGLELKREFLYLQVNDGQGIYTWIDYNGDGVKDLNEFEVAAFADQASYIRVFTPSNSYVKTYSNEYNQSIYWRPERIWASKTGILHFLSRFSDQVRGRIQRKTNYFDGANAFNPFVTNINDTSLISTNSNFRNTLFFNRTSSIVGAEYTFHDVRSKTLLASGFDSRMNSYHELSFRWNIKRKFTIKLSGKIGEKQARADYTSGRDFRLDYYFVEPSFIFQPGTKFRVTLDGRISEKRNHGDLGGERSQVYEIGTTFKFNQPEKGSLQGGASILRIVYDGIQNSALGFEMLEGLKPGVNYTWTIGYQRSISKNLQLSVLYNGRKSEGNKVIHSGGMEVRAFF
ncbi:MAG: hypothetical protein QNK23_16920 [Crocinitomicaceae bacterium]|nr:hypothetical protein [Crocinitomicaceae bacterium]